jgi:SAM-dependent methyltransferase
MFSERRLLTGLTAGVALCLAMPPVAARQQASPPAQQQQPFEPYSGMPGKDVVWVPTHPAVVAKMLDMAKVTPQDFVVDLGSGDGRNVIAAAKRGARAVGFEYNPDMVALSRKLATEAGVADKATFVQGDMYEADFSQANVLALFLLTSNLDKLKDKILALKPGSRVVLNTYGVTGWEPDERATVEGECSSWCSVLLHIVPARVSGIWSGNGIQLQLTQDFQRVSGTIVAEGAKPAPIESALLRGEQLSFSAGGTSYTGKVNGDQITGTAMTTATNARRNWTLTRERK